VTRTVVADLAKTRLALLARPLTLLLLLFLALPFWLTICAWRVPLAGQEYTSCTFSAATEHAAPDSATRDVLLLLALCCS
jgi:hypothetical protein